MEREEERNSRIAVGGPDILTLRNISVLAAGAAGVLRPRCVYLQAGVPPRSKQRGGSAAGERVALQWVGHGTRPYTCCEAPYGKGHTQ